jgi:DNA-directed RNA polymerase specialized sigma24 family protein
MLGLRFRFLNDRTLMQLIRTGNEEALIILYSRTWKQVLRYILRSKGRMRDAEETLSDALLTTWQRVIRQKQEQPFALAPSVLATARNYWNKKEKIKAKPVKEQGSLNGQLTAEWSRLPEADRKLLGLYYFDGFSFKEIAEICGLPGADKARQRRSELLRELKQKMATPGNFESETTFSV